MLEGTIHDRINSEKNNNWWTSKNITVLFSLILEDSSGNTQVKESQAGNPSLVMDTS